MPRKITPRGYQRGIKKGWTGTVPPRKRKGVLQVEPIYGPGLRGIRKRKIK